MKISTFTIIITACVLMIPAYFLIEDKIPTKPEPEPKRKFIMYDKPAECVTTNTLRVSEVINEHYALAEELDQYGPTFLLVVIKSDTPNSFYEQQKIEIPEGKCARQTGIYKYHEYLDNYRTYAIVEILDQ